MRLFCGLSIAYQVRRNIELLLEHLRPQGQLSWTNPANLHVTTKFIGEWPKADLPRLVDALRAIPPVGEMEIAIRGLGWFPNPHQPRVFFAGVAAPPALDDLHAATDRALTAIGVAGEKKTYQPHLTLARVKNSPDLGPLRRAVAALPSADFGKYPAAKHLLYASETAPSGSVYRVLAEVPLS